MSLPALCLAAAAAWGLLLSDQILTLGFVVLISFFSLVSFNNEYLLNI